MKIKLLLFALIILLLPSITFAQQGEILKINNALSEAKLVATSVDDEHDHEHEDGRFFFELNDEMFEEGLVKVGSRIAVDVAPGDERLFEISRVSNYTPGTTSFIARDVNEQSRLFTFTYSNNTRGIDGLFHDTHTRVLKFSKDKASGLSFAQVANNEHDLFCTVDHEHEQSTDWIQEFKEKKSKTASSNANVSIGSTLASVYDTVTVDVMLVLTQNGRNWALLNSSGPDEVLAQSMNLSQSALDNSGTALELRVVHVYDLDLPSDEQSQASGEKLRRITNGNGIYNAVHNARDEHGADLVALIDEIGDTGGIAWVLTNPGGASNLGFSVNRIQQITTGYTLVHEMGHNMGSFHSREQPTQRAPLRGGVFHYSVGKQDPGAGFHTVMAYSAAGLTQAPVFSGPDVFHLGNPTGSDDAFSPENGARSLREIKRTMASNRPTTTEPPVPGLSSSSIDVELGTNQELSVPITVTNTGASRMMWGFDFELTGTPGESGNPLAGDNTLYSSSFEVAEGFGNIGSFPAVSRWRPLSGGNVIQISNANPSDGTNHIRIDQSGGGSQTMVSPYLGSLPLGKYEVSFDLYLPTPSTQETVGHNIFMTESNSGSISAGISIFNREVFAWGKPEVIGVGSYLFTGALIDYDQYNTVRIVYNTDEQKLQYFINDVLIASNNYTVGANSPDQIFFEFGNEVAGSYMDVDNVQMRTLGTPFTWLQPEEIAGSIAPGGQTEVMLNFAGAGLSPGVYQTNLQLKNNSAETPIVSIPVNLTVNLSVSTEDDTEIPEEVGLDQNFPNPFNPTTNITFRLNNSSNVTLAVYNMLGQQVATVAQGRFAAGSHTVPFNAQNLSSGVYVYQLRAGNVILNRKLTLIK